MNKVELIRNTSRPLMSWFVLCFSALITLLEGFGVLNLKESLISLWTTIAVGIPIAWIAGRSYEKSKLKENSNV